MPPPAKVAFRKKHTHKATKTNKPRISQALIFDVSKDFHQDENERREENKGEIPCLWLAIPFPENPS